MRPRGPTAANFSVLLIRKFSSYKQELNTLRYFNRASQYNAPARDFIITDIIILEVVSRNLV